MKFFIKKPILSVEKIKKNIYSIVRCNRRLQYQVFIYKYSYFCLR